MLEDKANEAFEDIDGCLNDSLLLPKQLILIKHQSNGRRKKVCKELP